MRIRVPDFYKGLPSDFKPIFPGDYDSEDPRLFGLAAYLVNTGHAEVLDAPLSFPPQPMVETPEKGEVDLRVMTVAQLLEYAAGQGIDLGGARRRDDILALIETWLEARALPAEDDTDDDD